MNRRSFIGTLMASVAGLAIDPQALLWRPTLGAPLVVPEALLSLNQITYQLVRQLAPLVGTGQLLDTGRVGPGCERQLAITMVVPETLDVDGLHPRIVRDTGRMLLEAIRHDGLRQFGQPPLPLSHAHAVIVRSHKYGFALRGLYEPVFFPPDVCRQPVLRFDVLGGK